MHTSRSIILAAALLAGAAATSAQDLSRYRAYALHSSVASVAASSGVRPTVARTLHERPAAILELQWRAPYLGSRDTLPDPVRTITFSFYNDGLYQIAVSYDRSRTEQLADQDIIDSVSATYGTPVPATPPLSGRALPHDTILLARWENTDFFVLLLRGSYVPEFQLVVSSKALGSLACEAISESVRLDGIEAPQRAAAQRDKEAADASGARDKTRAANKAAFRP